MRLLLVGGACAEVAAAADLAAAGGAAVRHVATLEAALEQLRAGRGADLLMLDAADRIDSAIGRLTAERFFLPIVAYAHPLPARTSSRGRHQGRGARVPAPAARGRS